MRARAAIVLVVVLGAAAAVWFGLRRHQTSTGTTGTAESEPLGADAQTFVGKWTFAEGTMKSDWDFPGADQGKHEVSLAGKSITVVERDNALWRKMDGDTCLVMLATKAPNVAELVADKTICPADAGTKLKTKSNQMTISLDATGRAHVTGASLFSLEVSGTVHEGRVDFGGVADKQTAAGP